MGVVCVVTVQKTEEVPQLQFIDKVAVQTSTSGGYGVLPVCEGFFLLLAVFFLLLFGVECRLSGW